MHSGYSMDAVYSSVLNEMKISGVMVNGTIELMNQTMTLWDPTRVHIHNKHRKFSEHYAYAEFLWYLGRDRNVGSMPRMAAIWGEICDIDNEVESNYGTYVFSELWGATQDELQNNPDSRRAVIPILAAEHIGKNIRDYPCTGFVQFTIRDDRLNLHWHMRSQDIIFGMANDFFAASMIQQAMLNHLRARGMELSLGQLIFQVSSLHIYERHYHLLFNGGDTMVHGETRHILSSDFLVNNESRDRYGIHRDDWKDSIDKKVELFKQEQTIGG